MPTFFENSAMGFMVFQETYKLDFGELNWFMAVTNWVWSYNVFGHVGKSNRRCQKHQNPSVPKSKKIKFHLDFCVHQFVPKAKNVLGDATVHI